MQLLVSVHVLRVLRSLLTPFKEAQVALEVGKVFDTEQPIVSYENLGIAVLFISFLQRFCDMFLRRGFQNRFNRIA